MMVKSEYDIIPDGDEVIVWGPGNQRDVLKGKEAAELLERHGLASFRKDCMRRGLIR